MPHQVRADDLLAFSRSSPQSRDAALLRATTDLFCQEEVHDRDALRRYEELATYFLPRVAAPDRAYVARRLADQPDAPPAALRLLARDEIEIATPVLSRSDGLGPVDLLGVIAAGSAGHRRLIAARPDLDIEVVTALRLVGDAGVDSLLDFAGYPPLDPATLILEPSGTESSAPALADSDPESLAARAVAGFLTLEPSARLALIAEISERQSGPHARSLPRDLDHAIRSVYRAAQIVTYARSGNLPELVDAFAEVLGIDPPLVSILIDDPSGEALVLLAKAAGLSGMEARTVFLLANPAIGHSVDAFTRLADLEAGLEREVAESFVAAWRERPSAAASAGPPGHVPYYADVARRSAGAAARTPPADEQRIARRA